MGAHLSLSPAVLPSELERLQAQAQDIAQPISLPTSSGPIIYYEWIRRFCGYEKDSMVRYTRSKAIFLINLIFF